MGRRLLTGPTIVVIASIFAMTRAMVLPNSMDMAMQFPGVSLTAHEDSEQFPDISSLSEGVEDTVMRGEEEQFPSLSSCPWCPAV